jgi:hypothetical protein
LVATLLINFLAFIGTFKKVVNFHGGLFEHHTLNASLLVVLEALVEAATTVVAHVDPVFTNVCGHLSLVRQDVLVADFSHLLTLS